MTILRVVLSLFLLCLATACTSVGGLRPGVSASALDAERELPVGKRYAYVLKIDQVPLDVTVAFTSSKASAKRLRFDGEMVVTVTDPNLAEALTSGGALGGAAGAKFDGSSVRTPVGILTDLQGRSVQGALFGADVRYRPHDCTVTLGICRYAEIDGNETTHYIVNTTETDGVWTSVAKPDPAKSPGRSGTIRAQYTLDSDGFVKDADYVFEESGTPIRMALRRVN